MRWNGPDPRSGSHRSMTAATSTAATSETRRQYVSTREAAFIGVGAMVGAGIFSLLGTAAEVAGAAVWLSFLLAGGIAALQGYSFAKLGARYPTAGGLLEYVNRAFGEGRVATVTAWLTYSANAIVTAMVAVSFGSYASAAIADGDPAWAKAFAGGLVLAMTGLNIAGSGLVAKVQSLIVFVVVGILGLFGIVTTLGMDSSRLAVEHYPGVQQIVSSVALTFFAFLGFGVVTFTAKDLREPSRQLPRAIAIAIGLATAVYVLVSLGVFGTLDVEEVIAAGPTAIAVAAEPVLGTAGYWLMLATALFATAGATNAGLYPATGLSDHLAETGQFPPVMRARIGGRAPVGLVAAAVAVIVMVVLFDLSAIASIGSTVALMIFALVTAGHLRIRSETGARLPILALALAVTAITLLTFVFTTLIQEPASIVTLAAIVLLSFGLDEAWRRRRAATAKHEPTA
jgi:amino acid transporter